MIFRSRTNRVVSRASSNEYSASPAASPAYSEETEVQNLSTDRPLQTAEGSTSAAIRKKNTLGGPQAMFHGETDEQSLGFTKERRQLMEPGAQGAPSGLIKPRSHLADKSRRPPHSASLIHKSHSNISQYQKRIHPKPFTHQRPMTRIRPFTSKQCPQSDFIRTSRHFQHSRRRDEQLVYGDDMLAFLEEGREQGASKEAEEESYSQGLRHGRQGAASRAKDNKFNLQFFDSFSRSGIMKSKRSHLDTVRTFYLEEPLLGYEDSPKGAEDEVAQEAMFLDQTTIINQQESRNSHTHEPEQENEQPLNICNEGNDLKFSSSKEQLESKFESRVYGRHIVDKISESSDIESSFQYEGQGSSYNVLKDEKSPDDEKSDVEQDQAALTLPLLLPFFKLQRKCGYYSIEHESDEALDRKALKPCNLKKMEQAIPLKLNEIDVEMKKSNHDPSNELNKKRMKLATLSHMIKIQMKENTQGDSYNQLTDSSGNQTSMPSNENELELDSEASSMYDTSRQSYKTSSQNVGDGSSQQQSRQYSPTLSCNEDPQSKALQEEIEQEKLNKIKISQQVLKVNGKVIQRRRIDNKGKMVDEQDWAADVLPLAANLEPLPEDDMWGRYEIYMNGETFKYFHGQVGQTKTNNSNNKKRRMSIQSLKFELKKSWVEQQLAIIMKFLKKIWSLITNKNHIFMIEQNDPNKTRWELFVIILALYNAFSIPFELAFDPEEMRGTNFLIMNTFIDLLFGIDIFIQFRTTFYHSITGDEVKDLNIIRHNYLKGRFLIDILSTIPFDNLLKLFTGSENQILAMFSLLKIVRVNRLGRIIARLNVSEDTKNSLKLFQLVFFIVMYIHCSGCGWYAVINYDKVWIPPLDYQTADMYLYDDSILRKYFISVYSSVLLLSGNDVFPASDFQTFFVVFSNTVGAIINANILGNMAVLIQDLNKKTDAFQKKLDRVNTAMQNIRLPPDLQSRVVGFLQYTQKSQENQKEMIFFIKNISPSLKHQVIEFIFQNVIDSNPMLQNDKQLVNILFSRMDLLMYDPEEVIIRQGQLAQNLYFISKGECEVTVADENREDTFVRIITPGEYFGEIGLIQAQHRRTANIQTKNYSNIGHISKETFNEIVLIFPDLKQSMRQNMIRYQDKYRCWQKYMLLNVQYFRELNTETYEELIFHIQTETVQAGYQIFTQGKYNEKIYILISGEVELYFDLKKKRINVENLWKRGQIMNEISSMTKNKIKYSARAVKSCTFLTLSYHDINDIMLKCKDLRRRINNLIQNNGNAEFDLILDYTRTPFYEKQLDRHWLLMKDKQLMPDVLKKKEIRELLNSWCLSIHRLMKYQKFIRNKEGKIHELIQQLKRQNSGLIKKEARQTEEVIEGQKQTMRLKIHYLVIKQINMLQATSEMQSEQLQEIVDLIKKINEMKNREHRAYRERKQSQISYKSRKNSQSSLNDIGGAPPTNTSEIFKQINRQESSNDRKTKRKSVVDVRNKEKNQKLMK